MVRNYFKVLWRNTIRNWSYTFINALGLTLGISCALSIFLYVHDELTFDSHHLRGEEIYRLNGGWRSLSDQGSAMYPLVGYVVGEMFEHDFPEVKELTRLRLFPEVRFQKEGLDEYIAEPVYAADTSFFDLFTIKFLHGDAAHALPDLNSIVLSRKAATKYFDKTDVIGKTIRGFGTDTVDFKVTGVIEDYPDNTRLRFDCIVKLEPPSNPEAEWFEFPYMTFFTVQPHADLAEFEAKAKRLAGKYVSDLEKKMGFEHLLSFTPFRKIHLHSHLQGENNPQASQVYVFLIVGLFIIIMACINFINLSTARSVRRAKEIGIRKVIGALKSQLIPQFLGEACLITMLSALLACATIFVLLPDLNSFAGKNIVLGGNGFFWGLVLLIIVLVTILAGGYPALVLASFKPVDTLKGQHRQRSGSLLRKGLVVFQFAVSISLIGAMLIAMSHLKYLRSKALGFDKERIVVLQGANRNTKEELLNIPGVTNTSLSNRVPGGRLGGRTIYNGWDASDHQVVMGQLVVDFDYIDLYKLEVVAGRGFNRDSPSDLTEAFLVNEAATKMLGHTDPAAAVGGELWLDEDWGGKKGRIIGVLKDFHFNGTNAAIEPLCMFMNPTAQRNLSVKLTHSSDADIPALLKQVESVFHATVPNRPFEYNFLDEAYDQLYKSEERFMTILSTFGTIGILIGCLGLYGLAAFMAEERVKEVGIRKTLGASVRTILLLLTSDFLKLVSISFIIAVPVAYYGMNEWLESYPFHERIRPVIFLITGVAVVLLAALSVGYQALRAARANPVLSLRGQ